MRLRHAAVWAFVLAWSFGCGGGTNGPGANDPALGGKADDDAEVTVSGVVADPSGQPIAGLTVSIRGADAATETGDDGRFTLVTRGSGKRLLDLAGDEGVGTVAMTLEGAEVQVAATYPVTTEIVLLHVNDLHANIHRFPQLVAEVKRERTLHGNVFLVAAGDLFSGNPFVDQAEERGYPMIALMNLAGFDASALGNHDFDYGQEVLNDRRADATFPFVCANMTVMDGVLQPVDPFVVRETDNGIRVAFLGLIETDLNDLPSTLPERLEGITFVDAIDNASSFAGAMDGNDVLVVLSHLGAGPDRDLAQALPGIDVIVGSHSHTVMSNPQVIDGALITQAGANLKYLGRVVLTLRNQVVADRRGDLIDLESAPDTDAEAQAMVDGFLDNAMLQTVVAVARADIRGKDQLGSMMTDALTAQLGLDIAFQNNGGIRSSVIPKGDITLGQIYTLDPFDNPIVRFEMTAAEIRSLIAGSLFPPYNNLQVSGMTYRVTTDAAHQIRDIAMTDAEGQPLDADGTFIVGMNSFIATTYTFDHADVGTTTGATSTAILIEYLRKVGSVDYTGVKRAFFESN